MSGAAAGARPNIILVILDTVRQDALSCYGNPLATTPNIDALAQEGALYLDASSSSPWTGPSIASMLTGLVPSDHGYDFEHLSLDTDRTTLAEVLGKAGYEVGGHDDYKKVPKGFDDDHPRAELLKMKGLTGGLPEIPKGMLFEPELAKFIADHGKAFVPMVKWLQSNVC